jgi:hypothetical protein
MEARCLLKNIIFGPKKLGTLLSLKSMDTVFSLNSEEKVGIVLLKQPLFMTNNDHT